jgi:serine/threonine-protein kinase
MNDPAKRRAEFQPTLPASEGPRSRREYVSGDTIDRRYRLLRKLEQGGMGEVWVAHSLALDVHVALKLILPEQGSDLADERLLREARAAARLGHPAVVRVLDTGRAAGGEPYLVMELLDGETLAEAMVRLKRMDPAIAVRTLLPIAGALAAMHDKGMVHRDVKPENIFLSRDDAGRTQPKLIDFGIAKVDERSGLRRLTRRGALVGTPGYMAPEQVQGSADARADVWAFCVVLYEALAGTHAFVGDTYPLLIAAVLAAAPPPLADHGVRDETLASIVERGIRPVEERWQTVEELGRALAAWLWSQGETEDITGVSLRSSWLGDDVRQLVAPQIARHVETQRMPMSIVDRARLEEVSRARPEAAPPSARPEAAPPIAPIAPAALPAEMAPAAEAPVAAPEPPPPPTPVEHVSARAPSSSSSAPPLSTPLSVAPSRSSTWIPLAIVGAGLAVAASIVGVAALRSAPASDHAAAAGPAPSAQASAAPSPDPTADAPLPAADHATATPPPTAAPAPPTRRRPSNAMRDGGPAPGGELKNPFR